MLPRARARREPMHGLDIIDRRILRLWLFVLSFRYHLGEDFELSDILIRGLDAQTVKRLKTRAKRNGRSLQSEVKQLLERAADKPMAEVLDAARGWRVKLGKRFDDSVSVLRRDRDR